MSIFDNYNYNTTPTQIDREEYTDVGSSSFKLGYAARVFGIDTDFEIWTAASGGTQLEEGTDYELLTKNNLASSRLGFDVMTRVRILNATYQTGSIFITYKVYQSETDADYFNYLLTRINSLGAGSAYHQIVNCQLANDTTDTTNDLSIATGFCYDDTYTNFMSLETGLIKQIDAAFAEGTNAGMMQSGQSLTASSWYNVYLISKADGTTDVQCTIYSTALVLPSGYTYKRRLGCIYVTAASAIRHFIHTWQDKTFKWVTKTVVTDWSVPPSATLTALDVPLGISVRPLAMFSGGTPADANQLEFNIYSPDEIPPAITSSASSGHAKFNGIVCISRSFDTGDKVFSNLQIFKTNTSGQLYFHKAYGTYYSASYYSTLHTHGWVDYTL